MFFIIAKSIGLVLKPGNLGLFLLLLGTALAASQSARWLGIALLAVLTLIGASLFMLPVADWLAAPLEDRFDRPSQLPHCIRGIIVLGSGEMSAATAARGVPVMPAHVLRLVEAAALLREHPEAVLLFSGGGVRASPEQPSEADIARAVFARIGADPARIRYEARSRTTWENLRFAKDMAMPKPGDAWVLVTSAMHLPRAVGAARRLGWRVIPWPSDYTSIPDARTPGFDLARNLARSQVALHEWLGLLAYRLTSRSAALLPGPEPGGGMVALGHGTAETCADR